MEGARILLSGDHFQLAVRLVADHAMFLLDRDGIVKSWNLGAERIKGYRADEIVGHHFGRLYTNEDASNSRPDVALRIASDRGRFEGEGWRLRRDGSLFWARVVITALHDEQQHLVGFMKVTEDLGERHIASMQRMPASPVHQPARSNAAHALRAEHILTGVLEHVPEAVVLTDVRGIAVLASSAAEKLFGVRRGFFVRRPLINVVARQDTRPFRALVKGLERAPAGTIRSQVVRMRSRTGPVHLVSTRVTRLDAPRDAALHWSLCPVSAVSAVTVPERSSDEQRDPDASPSMQGICK